MMSDKPTDIPHLRRLLEEGTPGPWECDVFEVYPSQHFDECDGGCDDEGAFLCGRLTHDSQLICETFGLSQFAEKDARLIAAAVNALPGLLDEVEQLTEAFDRLNKGTAIAQISLQNRIDRALELLDECPLRVQCHEVPGKAKCRQCLAVAALIGKE